MHFVYVAPGPEREIKHPQLINNLKSIWKYYFQTLDQWVGLDLLLKFLHQY